MRYNTVFTLATMALGFAGEVIAKPNVVIGYYPSWKKQYMPAVDFTKYTHINLGDWFEPQVVTEMHGKGVKVLMSNPTTRSTLLTSMVNHVRDFNLDGIDIDWEYPGRLGNNCNVVDAANDTPNFLKFLQDLRAQFDSTFGTRKKLINLAVRVEPFDVVDYANLMQYDVNGGWNPQTGPNAPFNYEKGKGMQVSFLTAGLGFYGRSTTATVDMTKDPNNQYQNQSSVVPIGDSEDGAWWDSCAGSGGYSGNWQWKHLRDQGILTSPTTAAAPWVRKFDPISQTPWLFNPNTKIFISYDDPQSLKVKVDYAAAKGLGGAMVWSVNMDYNNELMNVIQAWPGNGDHLNSQRQYFLGPGTSSVPITTSAQVTTSASATTSAPATTSTTGGSGPVAGGPCSSPGAYQCATTTGKNPAYFICNNGAWLQQACGSGTACFQSGANIVCNWPSA
ncbi:glycoside hydrolase [Linderina pennispora]|uniref:Glycoside hydrolase n=1 Tax=Linderina pennispora TaxID=61395 RepID=A0A1Y1WAZ4_9FUNG|nr:glycoside hydrolase [Linderina pennispora]ORX70709.1 glycoside hydrolase [Linderina pennispora]